ncbi:MAG: DNA translocase FtsK 4TM domain-containing protein [Lachnospiraceae bacterium]|nr:DNA translocase FtsK 4TM domain-containing protein [Lachnospiraceae bacterium]
MAAKKSLKASSESKNSGKIQAGLNAGNSKYAYKSKGLGNSLRGNSLLDEAIIICVIVFSVVVFISLINKNMGLFGDIVSGFLFGFFGLGAFLIPTFSIILCIWLLAAEKRTFFPLKLVAAILFSLTVSIFTHIVSGNSAEGFKAIYASGSVLNGGFLGAFVGDALVSWIGTVSSIIVLIGLAIVFTVIGTGKSFFSFILASIDASKEHRKHKNEKIKIKAERIREKEEKEEFKRNSLIEKNKHKKGNFNIKIREDEGINEDKNLPVVEALCFDKGKRTLPPIDGGGYIYDFSKDNSGVLGNMATVEEGTLILDEASTAESGLNLKPGTEDAGLKDSPEKSGDNALETEKKLEESIKEEPKKEYQFPPINLLGKPPKISNRDSKSFILGNAKKLEETLKSFGVEAKVVQISKGPTVTRYELSPNQGVKVSKIVNLADDIALNLAASAIRIEAPIPGKAAVGIEIPNAEAQSVYLRKVLESDEFKNFPSKLAFAVGEDIAGNSIVTDIAKMPHLLIAGATGSGKSVCINTLILSILYKAKPDEVKLLLVDPKVVELSIYNGIPHLLIPVVTDPKKAAGALNWAVREMLQRYNTFAENNVRDIKGYNELKEELSEEERMSQIVIIIDELADLMMVAPSEVEDAICRLAQMARAAGIHLIIATQRPSVDVITGVIKANIPSRMAFAVSSSIDSRTILDSAGAEKLLGKGDMLFSPVGTNKPLRIQGAFVKDKEVESIVDFLKNDNSEVSQELIDKITSNIKNMESDEEADEFLDDAIRLVIEKEKASVSMLQRVFRIGYNRAARLMEDLEKRGVVGPEDGSKPRKVLITLSEYEELKGRNN